LQIKSDFSKDYLSKKNVTLLLDETSRRVTFSVFYDLPRAVKIACLYVAYFYGLKNSHSPITNIEEVELLEDLEPIYFANEKARNIFSEGIVHVILSLLKGLDSKGNRLEGDAVFHHYLPSYRIKTSNRKALLEALETIASGGFTTLLEYDRKKKRIFNLLEKPIIVNVEGEKNALHYAVSLNELDLAKRLLEKNADVNAYGVDGPPIFTALKFGFLEVLKLLLEAGTNVNFELTNPPSRDITTPLSFALHNIKNIPEGTRRFKQALKGIKNCYSSKQKSCQKTILLLHKKELLVY
jgi:hypothetical protein